MALRVFSDLVANLQLLDAKANALAQCDFDDPILIEPMLGGFDRKKRKEITAPVFLARLLTLKIARELIGKSR